MAQVDQASVERVDERCDPLLYRLVKVYMRGSFERSLPPAGLGRFDADTMVALMQRVIERAASDGDCCDRGPRRAPFLKQSPIKTILDTIAALNSHTMTQTG